MHIHVLIWQCLLCIHLQNQNHTVDEETGQTAKYNSHYIPWNQWSYKHPSYRVEHFGNKTVESDVVEAVEASSGLSRYTLDQTETNLVRNVTHYLQPSPDGSLPCTALVQTLTRDSFDLLSIPCDLRLPQTRVVCNNRRPHDNIDRNTSSVKHRKLERYPLECPDKWFLISSGKCVQLKRNEAQKDFGFAPNVTSTCATVYTQMDEEPFAYSPYGYKVVTGYRMSKDVSVVAKHLDEFEKMNFAIFLFVGLVEGYLTSVDGMFIIQKVDQSTEVTHILCEQEPKSLNNKTCSPGMFRCEDQTCIMDLYRCNGDLDCPDYSDEEACEHLCSVDGIFPNVDFCRDECQSPHCICDLLYFQCQDGGCIDSRNICDGKSDCTDCSDEKNCVPTNNQDIHPSTPETYKCKDGFEISRHLVDDLMADCKDFSDECKVSEIKDILDYGGVNINNKCRTVSSLHCHPDYPACFEIDELCIYDLDSEGNLKSCRHGYHLEFCEDHACEGYFKCPNSYCLPVHRICDWVADCKNGEDELDCNVNLTCPGLLKCRSGWCVHPQQICDGQVHCGKSAEDESICTQPLCPENCTCISASVSCSDVGIHDIPTTLNHRYFIKILLLINTLIKLYNDSFVGFDSLKHLNLSRNQMKGFYQNQTGCFAMLINLSILDLSHNQLSAIPPMIFAGLKYLLQLDLRHNSIKHIDSMGYLGLESLLHIDLSSQGLETIDKSTFIGKNIIASLNLYNNSMKDIPGEVLQHLKHLKYLNVRSNKFNSLTLGVLRAVPHIDTMIVDYSWQCCMATSVGDCDSLSENLLSTCEDLLGSTVLRVFVWFTCSTSFAANSFALGHRTLYIEERFSVQNILIINLSLADFLTSIYQLLLLSYDLRYRGIFAVVSPNWMKSSLCQSMSVLSTVSACMSLWIVAAITVTRFLRITKNITITPRITMLGLIISWSMSILITCLPLTGAGQFAKWQYIKSEACLLFNFAFGIYPGWWYGFVFYVLLNVLAFALVFVAYGKIILHVLKSEKLIKDMGGMSGTGGVTFKTVRSVLLLVGCSLLLWLPVLVISTMTISNVAIPQELYG